MTQLLREFVVDSLRELGAVESELASGVFRYALPDGASGVAAKYFGRPTGELLLTFDASRWEEGARVECITAVAPLVRRLAAYAQGRGVWAEATIPRASSSAAAEPEMHIPYLLGRFCARFSGVTVHQEGRWLGLSLATGSMARISGDPFDAPGLCEGPPLSDRRAKMKLEPVEGLARLVDAFEKEAAERARRFACEADSAYRAEVEDAARVMDGDELAERTRMLAARYSPSIEMHLEAALLLWR